jgi:hypothetical protein
VSAAAVLGDIVAALDRAGIPHMLTGSLAAAYHGAARATMDVDLVIDPTDEQVRRLVGGLPGADYYVSLDAALEARRNESLFNVIHLASGWKIDLIIRKSRPFSRAEFDRRRTALWEGTRLSVATVEDVILAKLEWPKLADAARQLEDVAALLRVVATDLDQPYVDRWADALGVRAQWDAVRGTGR